MLETLFLGVLIIALIIGNLLLFFTNPKNSSNFMPKNSTSLQEELKQQVLFSSKNNEIQQSIPSTVIEEAYLNQSKIRALEEKIRLAHYRLNDLEKTIKNNNNFLIQKLDFSRFEKKLKQFEEFKSNTVIELAALKQIINELKANSKNSNKQELKKEFEKANKKIDDLEERIKSIVFRAGK
jgi:predicted nuclease with TOPRIM domain